MTRVGGAGLAPTAPTVTSPGARDLHRAKLLLAALPLGLVAGLLAVTMLASSMGVWVMTEVMEGPPATAAQAAALIALGELFVLALPCRATYLAWRAGRAGHPRATPTLVAGVVLGIGAAALPVIGMPGRPPTPADDSWRSWAAVNLTNLPPGAYERGESWPQTRSSGVVIAVHSSWTTSRSPRQACDDFAQALTAVYPQTVLGPIDEVGCLVRADGERITVEIHPRSLGSGAVADVIQERRGE